jgi:hypothetical protein
MPRAVKNEHVAVKNEHVAVPAAATSSGPIAPVVPSWNGDAEILPPVPETSARVDVTLTPLPDTPPCLGPEQVTPNDVRWSLHSRAEPGSMMRVLQGRVTAYFPWRQLPVAQVESGSAWVRGFVSYPEVVVRRLVLLDDSLVPDGVADRPAAGTPDGKLRLSVWVETGFSLSRVFPCADVTLVRHHTEPLQILPKAQRLVVLAQESTIVLHGTTYPLALFTVVVGTQRPLGAVAMLHERPAGKGRAWVSLEVCGGTLFGTVPSSALLGTPQDAARIAKCADVRTAPSSVLRLERVHSCDAEVPLYLHDRNPVHPDARVERIGSLKVGGLFQVDGPEIDGRVFITLADSPVELHHISGHFVVVEADLKRSCRRVR